MPVAALAATAVIGTATSVYSASQQKKAAQAAADAAQNLKYDKIDLDELQAKARQTAEENIVNSLALEEKYTPDVARARKELSSQISDELSMGGYISPDVARQVVGQAFTKANVAGLEGAAGPVTAATLGMTAMDLKNQRQAKAAQLLAANPLPESGLSPGDLASVSVGQQQAEQQFNIDKSQAIANAAAAKAQANASMVGAIGSGLSGIGSAYLTGTALEGLDKDKRNLLIASKGLGK